MRVVIKINKKTGKMEGFSSLESFFEKYPSYREKLEALNYYLTRKRTFYEDSEFKIYRLSIKGRVKKKKNGKTNDSTGVFKSKEPGAI